MSSLPQSLLHRTPPALLPFGSPPLATDSRALGSSDLMRGLGQRLIRVQLSEEGSGTTLDALSSSSGTSLSRAQVRQLRPEDLQVGTAGRVASLQLKAIRTGSDGFHRGAVPSLLWVDDLLISGGRDGRIFGSELFGSALMAQPISPEGETVLGDYPTETTSGPELPDEPMTAAAQSDGFFALGRRDGSIVRGRLERDPSGLVSVACTTLPGAIDRASNRWQVLPGSPHMRRRGDSVTQQRADHRIAGLALLPRHRSEEPLLVGASGQAIWTLFSHQSSSPTAVPVFADQEGSPLPDRLLSLASVGGSSSPAPLLAHTQGRALWMTIRPDHEVPEPRYQAGTALEALHTVASWLRVSDRLVGALGHSSDGGITYIEWDGSGRSEVESWNPEPDGRGVGSTLSIDHIAPQLIATGHEGSALRLWDVRSARRELELSLPTGRVTAVRGSPQQDLIAACLADDRDPARAPELASLAVWDLRRPDELRAGSTPLDIGSIGTSPAYESDDELFAMDD
jgi:hypothetical protein